MTDSLWFSIFALIFLVMGAVTLWMVWFNRHAMRSHKRQMEDMIREMKESMDEKSSEDK